MCLGLRNVNKQSVPFGGKGCCKKLEAVIVTHFSSSSNSFSMGLSSSSAPAPFNGQAVLLKKAAVGIFQVLPSDLDLRCFKNEASAVDVT